MVVTQERQPKENSGVRLPAGYLPLGRQPVLPRLLHLIQEAHDALELDLREQSPVIRWARECTQFPKFLQVVGCQGVGVIFLQVAQHWRLLGKPEGPGVPREQQALRRVIVSQPQGPDRKGEQRSIDHTWPLLGYGGTNLPHPYRGLSTYADGCQRQGPTRLIGPGISVFVIGLGAGLGAGQRFRLLLQLPQCV